jgi:hypothetical protein
MTDIGIKELVVEWVLLVLRLRMVQLDTLGVPREHTWLASFKIPNHTVRF